MAASSKLAGKGTLFQIKISAAFVTIGQRTEIDGPDPSLEMLDATDLDSTKAEYVPGLPDGGKVSGKTFYNPNDTTHIEMRDKVLAPPSTPDEFKLTFPPNSAVTTTPASEDFFGFLTKFKRTGMKQGELIQAEFEVQLSGTHTITPGS